MILGCQPVRKMQVKQALKTSPVFSSHFTGLCLYDPSVDKYLIRKNDEMYFTPASNMKILTAFNSLETFGDSLPAFAINSYQDSLIIQPLGDPTFLHPVFKNQPVLSYLSNYGLIKVMENENPLPAFGPGWAWDDFQYYYQTERSWFPVYGNMLSIKQDYDSLYITPEFFRDYVQIQYGEAPQNHWTRDVRYNLFNVWIPDAYQDYETEIPFDHDDELLIQLLSDTLDMEVEMKKGSGEFLYDTLYNQSTLDVLAYMIQTSDNFIAEQLLIQAAMVNGFTDIDAYRTVTLQKWANFNNLPIQWFDGSGLSRYNLITPLSLVNILRQIYERESWQTIQTIFPAGGKSGTLTNWYASDPPFIYAKTGTLSNNHSLSGFLLTDSGKTLIFSLMNNNYINGSTPVKEEMARLLFFIKKTF